MVEKVFKPQQRCIFKIFYCNNSLQIQHDLSMGGKKEPEGDREEQM